MTKRETVLITGASGGIGAELARMFAENGYDLVRAVRERPVERGGGVAAIALTAYASAEDARCAIRAGYQVHLAKPVESSQLVRIIERLARPGSGS